MNRRSPGVGHKSGSCHQASRQHILTIDCLTSRQEHAVSHDSAKPVQSKRSSIRLSKRPHHTSKHGIYPVFGLNRRSCYGLPMTYRVHLNTGFIPHLSVRKTLSIPSSSLPNRTVDRDCVVRYSPTILTANLTIKTEYEPNSHLHQLQRPAQQHALRAHGKHRSPTRRSSSPARAGLLLRATSHSRRMRIDQQVRSKSLTFEALLTEP